MMFRKICSIALFSLTLLGCDTNDDGFYNETYVEAENLVDIQQQPNYNVNDVLYVEALIPRLLQEVGQPNLLDVRQTTNNAPHFNFTFLLERKINDGSWEYVELSNRFVDDYGTGVAGSFIHAVLDYDATLEQYYFRGGIRLTETGEHRLSFGYNSTSLDKVELRSESTGQNLRLNISSTVSDIDSGGNYNFVVN